MKKRIVSKVVAVGVAVLAAVSSFGEQKNSKLIRKDGVGSFAVVNGGGANYSTVVSNSASVIEEMLQVEVKGLDGGWSMTTATKELENTKANAAVFVVKDAALPISLIALESRWGVVNADGLSNEAVAKEIIRVATVLFGSCYSQYPNSAMRPVFSKADLEEKAGSSLTLDALLPLLNGMGYLGVKPFVIAPDPAARKRPLSKKKK